MKKALYIILGAFSLVGCVSDDLRDPRGFPVAGDAIVFSNSTFQSTRTAQGDAAKLLDYTMNVYGVKNNADHTVSNVFAHSADSPLDPGNTYTMWYTGEEGRTSSNSVGWEYVGLKDVAYGQAGHEVNLSQDQTIKYWDYSAESYDFIAYSNTKGAVISEIEAHKMKVEGAAAQLGGLYVAHLHTAPGNKVVALTFSQMSPKVRIGFYETVPGYFIRDVKFRYEANTGSELASSSAGSEAILKGQFLGSASGDTYSCAYTLSLDDQQRWQATPSADTKVFKQTYNFGMLAYRDADQQDVYKEGAMTKSPALSTTVVSPTWAGTTPDGYQSVLPNSEGKMMEVKVDYTLYKPLSGETIEVKGASASVPEAFMSWTPNKAYTYLFKISDNTNGYTGTEGGMTPSGLYPISFESVVIVDPATQGTVTTLSPPHITTYQDQSVSDAGITYAHTLGDIYITVANEGVLSPLTPISTVTEPENAGEVRVYKESGSHITEDMYKSALPTGPLVADLTAGTPVHHLEFPTGCCVKFKPTEAGTYVVQYLVTFDSSDARDHYYAYKVIVVND